MEKLNKITINHTHFEDIAKMKLHIDIALIHLVNENSEGYIINMENLENILKTRLKSDRFIQQSSLISKLQNS